MKFSTADIRQFLTEVFSDEDLTALCFDYFRDVHDGFASGMTKGQKIQLLIEHCQRRDVIPNLLAALQRARPEQFEKRFPQAPAVEARPEPPRLERDPGQVFVSHAHADAELAHRLAVDLQTRGWRVWIAPDSIRPGEKWVEAINRGLESSGVFILVLTPAAVRSRWVKSETNVAIDLEHQGDLRFIPLEAERCDSVPPLWREYQWVPFRGRYEDGLAALLVALTGKPEEAERLEQERRECEAQEDAAREKAAQEEAERQAREEAERLEQERLERERLERQAREKAAQEEAECKAKEKAEAERLAAEKAEAERLAAEKAEAERKAKEKAEAERLAAEKAEAERLAAEKAEAERLAAKKAEAERLAAEKAEAERKAKEKAEAERLAAEKAEAERLAAEKAEAERKAKEKAEAERRAREKAAQSQTAQIAKPSRVPRPERKPRQPLPRRAWIGGMVALAGATVLALLVGVVTVWLRGSWGESTPLPTATAPVVAMQPTSTDTPHPPTATPTPAPPTPTPVPAPKLGDTRTRPSDSMVMVYVPAGEFTMGSTDAEVEDAFQACKAVMSDCQRQWFKGEQPVHTVSLDDFWIDRTEVTNAQYARCVAAGKCGAPSETSSHMRSSYYGDSQYDDYPVIYVIWNNARAYCAWAGVRLPTEAEWEYAARGPDGRVYPWGNGFDGTRLNYCDVHCTHVGADNTSNDGYADTAPVGSYPGGASWVGALDMAGNVWEWVADWYGDYPSEPQVNPNGPPSGGESRVLRGGGLLSSRSYVRVAVRLRLKPYYYDRSDVDFGFRCASGLP